MQLTSLALRSPGSSILSDIFTQCKSIGTERIVGIGKINFLLTLICQHQRADNHVDFIGRSGHNQITELHIGILHFLAQISAKPFCQLNIKTNQLIVFNHRKRQTFVTDIAGNQHTIFFAILYVWHGRDVVFNPAADHVIISAVLLNGFKKGIKLLAQYILVFIKTDAYRIVLQRVTQQRQLRVCMQYFNQRLTRIDGSINFARFHRQQDIRGRFILHDLSLRKILQCIAVVH